MHLTLLSVHVSQIDTLLNDLSKGKIKGKERKAKWEEVKQLRKECVFSAAVLGVKKAKYSCRYRRRETGAMKQVVGKAKVVLSTCHGYVQILLSIRNLAQHELQCWELAVDQSEFRRSHNRRGCSSHGSHLLDTDSCKCSASEA